MASIHAAGMSMPNHPLLYGTTLAISLVGGVAALKPGGVTLPVAGFEEALGLAGSASAAVPNLPAPPASVTKQVGAIAAAGQAPAGFVTLPERSSEIPTARPLAATVTGSETAKPNTRLDVAKSVPATGLQQELKAAPQAASAPAIVAVQEAQHDQPATATASPATSEPPSQSFNEAFQAVPTPSLATVQAPLPALPASETAAMPNVSAALIAPEPVQGRTSEAAAASALPPSAALTDLVAPTAASLAAAPAPQSAALALAAQPKLAAASALPSAATPAELVTPSAVPLAAAPTPQRAALALVTRPEPAAKPAAATAAPAVEPAAQPATTVTTSAAQPLHLISSPQLRKFDLGRIHVLPPVPPASLVQTRSKSDRLGKVGHAGAKDKLVDGIVFHRITVTVAGSPARTLELRIGADMKPSIKVGDLLAVVSDRMDPASVARFDSAASAQEYVSLADLRAAGFNVAYNAGTDSISITTGE
jgi:hypothetical protein